MYWFTSTYYSQSVERIVNLRDVLTGNFQDLAIFHRVNKIFTGSCEKNARWKNNVFIMFGDIMSKSNSNYNCLVTLCQITIVITVVFDIMSLKNCNYYCFLTWCHQTIAKTMLFQRAFFSHEPVSIYELHWWDLFSSLINLHYQKSLLPDCSTDRLFRLFWLQSIYTINDGRWSRKWVIAIGFWWYWLKIDENCTGNSIFKVPGVEEQLKSRIFQKIGKNTNPKKTKNSLSIYTAEQSGLLH